MILFRFATKIEDSVTREVNKLGDKVAKKDKDDK